MNKVFKNGSFLFLLLCFMLLAACSTNSVGNSSGVDNKKGNDSQNEKSANYPSEKIDMLVGFKPGGGTDITTRKITELLNSENLVKQTFVVSNMPGAMGGIALKDLKQRKGDPYTLMGATGFLSPLQKEGLGVNLTDFQPIATLTNTEVLILVPKDSPYNSVTELLDGMKEKQDLTISVVGPTDGGEAFTWDKIRKAYGIDKLNLVTTNGTSESFSLLLGGKVDAALSIPIVSKDYIKSGELKALAILSDERSEVLPDVPTLKEAGINVVEDRYFGVVAAAGISEEVISFWSSKLKELSQLEEWHKYLETKGLISEFKNSKEYTKYIEEEGKQYKEYINSLESK